MYTFKRGISHAQIYSLSLTIDKLVVSSDSGTLHVFNLDKHLPGLTTEAEEADEENKDSTAWRALKSVISSVVPKDYE